MAVATDHLARHQCMIYAGSPARTLTVMVAAIARQLAANYRCMYMNTAPMVAGLRSQLYGAGVDTERAVSTGALRLESGDAHLVSGRFDVDHMILLLGTAAQEALDDGYAGLFATGDMAFELGAETEFSKVLEYEWRLEQLFMEQPGLCGICQYNCDMVPPAALRHGFVSHQHLFISDTLSRLNPHYIAAHNERAAGAAKLDAAVLTTLS